jgi:hypothetical protein
MRRIAPQEPCLLEWDGLEMVARAVVHDYEEQLVRSQRYCARHTIECLSVLLMYEVVMHGDVEESIVKWSNESVAFTSATNENLDCETTTSFLIRVQATGWACTMLHGTNQPCGWHGPCMKVEGLNDVNVVSSM